MTLPKKGRRKICVDGAEYHWIVGTRFEHRRGTATVQLATGIGARLIVDTNGNLLPSHIENAIRFALANDWNPNANGNELIIGCGPDDNPPTYVVMPNLDTRYWQIANRSNLQ